MAFVKKVEAVKSLAGFFNSFMCFLTSIEKAKEVGQYITVGIWNVTFFSDQAINMLYDFLIF